MLHKIFILSITTVFVENFVLVKFLGICPFLGVSKKTDTALGMGMAVTFVMTFASVITWCVDTYILQKFNLQFLQIIFFILVIAAIVQLVEMFLKKIVPGLYAELGIYLPLITTNCAVLGVALLNVQNEFDLLSAALYGFFAGIGFTVAILLFAGVRERLEFSDVPEALKGLPIALISAGLIAAAFTGLK